MKKQVVDNENIPYSVGAKDSVIDAVVKKVIYPFGARKIKESNFKVLKFDPNLNGNKKRNRQAKCIKRRYS